MIHHRNRFVRDPFASTCKVARAGVTLIEAIMVIIVLSASATASLVFFRDDFVSEQSSRLATEQVEDVLRLARNAATTNQASVLVRRARQGGIDRLEVIENAGPFQATRTWAVDFEPGVRITGAPSSVVFSPLGSADRGTQWNVTQGSSVGTVGLSPVSGRVTKSIP